MTSQHCLPCYRCPPCRNFTPHLTDWYTSGAVTKDQFQIIFISSDRTRRQYDDYMGEMPWLALPFEDATRRQSLKKHYQVTSIPKLVLLDPNGDVISKEGRKLVLRHPSAFPWLGVDPNDDPSPEDSAALNAKGGGKANWSALICYGVMGGFAALATSFFYFFPIE
jgi:thiol-disulfide isomerase/thioredoxin